MHKLNLIYILSFLLLILIPRSEEFKRARPIFVSKNFHQNVALSFKDRSTRSLFLSTTLGDKSQVSKKVKKSYLTLNLIHLFTPSGIHFAALYFLLSPLFKKLRKKSKKGYVTSSLLLTFLPYFLLGGFFALKRIALLKTIQNLGNRKYFSLFSTFGLTFVLDYFFGTFSESPLSFCASFLFLGIIISTEDKRWLPITLLGGQIILNYSFGQALTNTGFLFSFFLTGLFSFIYPLIFANFLALFVLPTSFSEFFLKYFNELVSFFSKVSIELGYFYPSLVLILATFIFSTKWKWIGLVLIFLHSDPTYNLPRYIFLRPNDYPQAQDFKWDKYKKIRRTKRGYSVVTGDNRKCSILIFSYYLERECKHL